MKTTNSVIRRRRFRRSVKKFFGSWIKLQNCNHLDEIHRIIEMLQEIEEAIEIVAREIYRQGKRGK